MTFSVSPFDPTSPFGAKTISPSHFPRPIAPTLQDFSQPMTFTLTLPDGTASADFLLPTPPVMGPFSAPIIGTDMLTDWTRAPWTMAEGVSPLRAEAAQGVGSLRSRPSSPEQNHNPYFPPLHDLQPPAASPVGARELSDALPHRPAGSRPSQIDPRGLLPAPRQPLHHSASDPQLHHARARAAAPAIGVGMYSPLSRQPWLPQDIEGIQMMGIDRQGIGMNLAMGSHLASGLGLHPRPPSTELDGDESGSGSEPGMDATSRMSGMDGLSEMAINGDMNVSDLAMDDAQRMSGIPSDYLAMLLPPQTGAPPRWSSDVEALEGFTPETPTERQDYYRQTAEDTTRHFPGIRPDSLPANAPMTLGLEMPEQTPDPRLADLRSWNFAQTTPHPMMPPLHSAFRPMASPPLSGGGSPRPSYDLRLSAAGIAAGFQGLPASVLEQGRTRYMSEPGPFPSDPQAGVRFPSAERFHPSSTEGARFPHHPLHPQQPWDQGMMTIENANANEYSDGMPLLDPTNQTMDGERAYPTPLSAHPRLPVTGEGSANGSEVKFEHPSPRLLPLPE